jgi:hypothetical protein
MRVGGRQVFGNTTGSRIARPEDKWQARVLYFASLSHLGQWGALGMGVHQRNPSARPGDEIYDGILIMCIFAATRTRHGSHAPH